MVEAGTRLPAACRPLRRGIFQALVAAGTVLLAVGSLLALSQPRVDGELYRQLSSLAGGRGMDSLAHALGLVGREGLALGVLLLMVFRRYRLATLVGPTVLGTMVVHHALREFLGWQRLSQAQTEILTAAGRESWSFPSGHAAAGVAVGLMLLHGSGRWGVLLGGILLVPVPLSRLLVGGIFPSDVLAGAGLGLLVGAVVLRAPFRPWLADGTAVDPHPILRHWPEVFLLAAGAWFVRYYQAPPPLTSLGTVLGFLLMILAPFLVAWNLHVGRTPPRGVPAEPEVMERLRPLNIVLFVLGCALAGWCFSTVAVPWT